MTARAKPLVIAIDGPSGSGKSSVSRAVAQRLNLAYLDTGAMFRALTWWCAQNGVDLDDQSAVALAAKNLPLQMGTDPYSPSVQVAGVEIDKAIRTSEISESVSKVATNLGVRAELRDRQRTLITESVQHSGGVVARRAIELHGDADHAAVDATHDQIVRRDADDSTVSQFMHAAPGVTLVDTSDLDLQQSVGAVLGVVHTKTGREA